MSNQQAPGQKKSPLHRNRFWYGARGYALSTTFARLARHRAATFMTLLVIGISLSLPALFVFLAPQLSKLDSTRMQAPGLTTYLSIDIDDLHGASLAEEIANRPDVKSTVYISREEALLTLQQNTSLSDAVALLGVNPLPGSIIIQPQEAEDTVAAHRLLSAQLTAMPGIVRVQQDLQWVEKFQAMATLVKTAALVSAIVLVLASLMVIANTIRLELLRHTRESKVCHLLGAKPSFIRRPFLYLGAIYGLLGAGVASLLAVLVIAVLQQPVQNLARSYASDYQLAWPAVAAIASLVVGAALLGLIAAKLILTSPASSSFQEAD